MRCHRYAETLPRRTHRDARLNSPYARGIHRKECLKVYSPCYRVGTVAPTPETERSDIILDIRRDLNADAYVLRINNHMLFYNTD